MGSKKKFDVYWEETHVYKYYAQVEAETAAEAKRLVNSHDYDESRHAEFDRVKSVGRKSAIESQKDR